MKNTISGKLNNMKRYRLSLLGNAKIVSRLFLISLKQSLKKINILVLSKRVAVSFSILILGFSSVSTYAYFSPAVTMNSSLYGIKTNTENFILSTKKDPFSRTKYYIELMSKRIKEAEYLSEQNDSDSFLDLNIINTANAETISTTPQQEKSSVILTLENVNHLKKLALAEIEKINDTSNVNTSLTLMNNTIDKEDKVLNKAATKKNISDVHAKKIAKIKESNKKIKQKINIAKEEIKNSKSNKIKIKILDNDKYGYGLENNDGYGYGVSDKDKDNKGNNYNNKK